jgi:hypothetical protein
LGSPRIALDDLDQLGDELLWHLDRVRMVDDDVTEVLAAVDPSRTVTSYSSSPTLRRARKRCDDRSF